MYAIRLGEFVPDRGLDALRGIEGRRVKELYQSLAEKYGVNWSGRRYDRSNPESADAINKAINHAATAMYAASGVAVAATGTIPQLGFIHESSLRSFALDIADLFRGDITLPVAFRATQRFQKRSNADIEAITRRLAGRTMRDEDVIPDMIDQIKRVLDVDDSGGDA
jgi:CRISPR-associated protein Cas1